MRYLERLSPLSKITDILAQIRPIEETYSLPTWESVGFVAARDVIMPHDYPPRPRAAYDGYAVNSSETPGVFRVVGSILVGQYRDVRVNNGETFYVTVGAFLPEGADAVVPEEAVKREGDRVVVERKYNPYDNVDPPGSYAKKGDTLLRRGYVISVFDVVGLLDVGITRVKVFRRPKIAIFSTGDELITPPIDPDEAAELVLRGKVIESTGSLVEWYIRAFMPYVELAQRRVLGDDTEVLRKNIEETLPQVDAVIITGGAGPSEIDHFYKLGITGLRGFRMKPGRPTSIAVVNGKPIFGLSGYPISALHGVIRIVEPVMRKMANVVGGPASSWVYATLTSDVVGEFAQFIRAKVEFRDGEILATPLKVKHHTFTDPESSGVLLVPPGGAKRGDRVLMLLYRDLRDIGRWFP
ncbi:molybdopterin molybdotransferase MoeA [Thermoproteus tenax]|uniref:Molybdenum cofactor biosynthesis protein n=1 Tax=Thermoproteus tenax (strain ATCC 35583 / DSM 2078 / JCM 9277 / NBRC 100435 / Kra 1) TaxID=768679 RepID=G4RKZ0_THETK|nr:molybdopterin molybdotransferase MoeA [Thermoproteus tenax]CCC82235.1 molybdenum cofactor biosynthesis protein [Thermoproteus tenax Kra 1]